MIILTISCSPTVGVMVLPSGLGALGSGVGTVSRYNVNDLLTSEPRLLNGTFTLGRTETWAGAGTRTMQVNSPRIRCNVKAATVHVIHLIMNMWDSYFQAPLLHR